MNVESSRRSSALIIYRIHLTDHILDAIHLLFVDLLSDRISMCFSFQLEAEAIWKYAASDVKVEYSLNVISQAFDDYTCDPSRFCVGFNGGKDCTVILSLVNAVKLRKLPSTTRLSAYYAQSPERFDELDKFVSDSVERYDLLLIDFQDNIKGSLAQLKQQYPLIDGIFMGTRRSDLTHKNRSIEPFARTDGDWPDFLRISPILDWDFHQVWKFILDLKIPYCPLYDHGYTSLGSPSNTKVNPKLLLSSDSSGPRALPAYKLVDGEDERKGRIEP